MKTLKRLWLFILVSLMVLGPDKEGLAQDFSTGKLELKVESQGNLTLYTNPLLKQGLYLEDVGGARQKFTMNEEPNIFNLLLNITMLRLEP